MRKECTSDSRAKSEIEHGKYLLKHNVGEIWGWETPAGKKRWARRSAMLTSHLKPGMKVLEIGCGLGYFTKELARTGALITAIDISPDLLNMARIEIKKNNVIFKEEDAASLTFDDNSFDSIVGSSVLHHIDLDRSLKEFHRILRPGGTIHFTEPNMLNPQVALQKNIPYLKKILGDSPHETAFIRWGLKKRLAKHGFKDIVIRPFDWLHPAIPASLIPAIEHLGYLLERVPIIREFSGSIAVRCSKK